jgi:hypothetical protein
MAKDVKQGWQCPVCQTVYSPRVRSCKCAANAQQYASEMLRPTVSPNAPYTRYWIDTPTPDLWSCTITGNLIP